jgi:hypothetical protein
MNYVHNIKHAGLFSHVLVKQGCGILGHLD